MMLAMKTLKRQKGKSRSVSDAFSSCSIAQCILLQAVSLKLIALIEDTGGAAVKAHLNTTTHYFIVLSF